MKRAFILAGCVCATAAALYSCSMHASVATDASGHVVEVSSVRLESSLASVAVAMLVVGGEVALELRWMRGLSRPLDSVGG